MARKVITPEKEKIILANYLKLPSRDLANQLGVSKTAVLVCLRQNNKSIPIEIIKEWRKRKKLSKPYTESEKQFIKDNIDKLSIKQIAQQLKRCNAKIRPIIKELGLDHVVEQKKASLKNTERKYSSEQRQENQRVYERCSDSCF